MKLTWLHISDFHVRGGDPYDRDVVLRALVKSVARYRDQGRTPDVIFATGDIAHSGKPNEYEIAESFLNELLSKARLERDRLLLIPGNHDVNRDLGVGLARTLESREHSDTYFRPDLPKPHLTQKLQAYLAWYAKYFSECI
jgi:DNA repair exonuclease SbcCD nuclease subunit